MEWQQGLLQAVDIHIPIKVFDSDNCPFLLKLCCANATMPTKATYIMDTFPQQTVVRVSTGLAFPTTILSMVIEQKLRIIVEIQTLPGIHTALQVLVALRARSLSA
ncbi:hypothetical protein CHS0354_020944 [Potamilus streckersoni]|uniref:Uncharacterized protein n=1 Tax=Potamilus streckersoni TaxID=2493646 RepID=A0AAE0SR09_9BIVA|nr:hypothetical protein CHS0354_020944 [Potamilus streckersoni]